MGTNFYLRRVRPREVHDLMHIAKRSAGWVIHFQDSTEGYADPRDDAPEHPAFHSVADIRNLLKTGEWQLCSEEYAEDGGPERWDPGEESLRQFDELCRWRGGPRFTKPAVPYSGTYDHEPDVPYDQPVGGTAYRDADGYVFDERWFR